MKKRIVILSAFLSPHRSGAEAMVEEVSTRLSEDYEIIIVTTRSNRSLPKLDRLGDGVQVIRVGLGLRLDKFLFPLLGALKARKLKPKIVHAVLESYAGMALVLCRWIAPDAKRLLTLQSTNTNLLLGPIHRSADRITAISSILITRGEGFGRHDIELIPNGVPLAMINEAKRFHQKIPGRILFVGRLEPMKGVDALLQAFALLLRHVHPTSNDMPYLRIVGDGSQRAALQDLAKRLSILDQIAFVGALPATKVYDEFAQAQIFCGLSRSEALGNVFLEAQAAGCAVVATHVGGIPDSVDDGVNGILVPPDDPSAAAQAIKRLLDDPALRERLSVAGQAGKERYDWGVIAKRYGEVYEKMF